MGKNRRSSVRKELLTSAAEIRKSLEDTYTQPIHPGSAEGLKEFQNWLGIFYRHVYRHEEELKRLLRQNVPVRQNYDRLVGGAGKGSGRLTHEDFFQRYLYRCDPQRVLHWEKQHVQTAERRSSLNGSSSSLLDDSAKVQVRQALAKEAPSVVSSEDSLEDDDSVASEPASLSAKKETKPKSPEFLKQESPRDAKRNANAWVLGVVVFATAILLLVVYFRTTPADNQLKVSVCEKLEFPVDLTSTIDLPWWSPRSWQASLSNALSCQQPLVELEVMQESQPSRPWSALNPVRWHRRRTQNYYTDGDVRVDVGARDEDLLQQDAAPRWSLLKWQSDQRKSLLASSSGSEDQAVSPWSALAQKVRGRGWKSKSWGETEEGEMVYEEQEISVTTEGHSDTSSRQRATDLTTTSSQKKYIKTVVTEVKKTTIYSPVN